MCDAIMHNTLKNRKKYIKAAENEIGNITGHKHVNIVNSGNSAILAVMSTFKDKILIPDQGGWIGFKKIAEFLHIETVKVPTNLGLMDPDVLEEIIMKHNPKALFLTSFAGYIAEQPIKQLYEVCNEKDVVLVEDASGAVGDKKRRLANGDHAHVIIASTGFPKIINVGNGGFISTDNYNIFKDAKIILNSTKADPITCAGISEEIKNAPEVLSKTMKACKILKKKFKSAIHKNKRGITVALSVDDPKRVGYELRKRLKTDRRSIITICPRYERIMADAVCIEIKNLDLRCLEKGYLENIIQNIDEVIRSPR